MKRFDEDQARHARITRCLVTIMSIRGRKTHDYFRSHDYRAAAQRILPPFLFHYMDGVHILNTRCAATWKICQKWRAPAYSEKHV